MSDLAVKEKVDEVTFPDVTETRWNDDAKQREPIQRILHVNPGFDVTKTVSFATALRSRGLRESPKQLVTTSSDLMKMIGDPQVDINATYDRDHKSLFFWAVRAVDPVVLQAMKDRVSDRAHASFHGLVWQTQYRNKRDGLSESDLHPHTVEVIRLLANDPKVEMEGRLKPMYVEGGYGDTYDDYTYLLRDRRRRALAVSNEFNIRQALAIAIMEVTKSEKFLRLRGSTPVNDKQLAVLRGAINNGLQPWLNPDRIWGPFEITIVNDLWNRGMPGHSRLVERDQVRTATLPGLDKDVLNLAAIPSAERDKANWRVAEVVWRDAVNSFGATVAPEMRGSGWPVIAKQFGIEYGRN